MSMTFTAPHFAMRWAPSIQTFLTCTGWVFLTSAVDAISFSMQVYMTGLCVVLLLYFVLIVLALVTWGQLSDGFEDEQTTRIACEVRS